MTAEVVSRDCIRCDSPGCGAANPRKRCARCRTVYYCSEACQLRNWRQHRADCVDVGWIKAQATEETDGSVALTAAAAPSGSPCGICLDEETAPRVSLSECGHAFCPECLREWHRVELASTARPGGGGCCPRCRTGVQNEGVKALIDRAMIYAARRANIKIPESDESREHGRLALAELDKVFLIENDNLQALFTKRYVLSTMDEPQLAVEVFEKLIKILQGNQENADRINDCLDQVRIAKDVGDDDEAERLIMIAEEITASSGSMVRLAGGKAGLFDIKIALAEAREEMRDWEAARDTYLDMFVLMDSPDVGTPVEQRKIFMGISRCFYELGDYDRALTAGEGAIEMNRHFPGVHKYVALAHKAKGELARAVETMNRAVLYETPWDEGNVEKAMKLFEELKGCSS